jgi:hypothetical protein
MVQAEIQVPDTVEFQSKFFTALKDAYFFKDDLSGECRMSMSLGNKTAAVKLDTLKSELKLSDGDPDAVMLEFVAKSLDYLRALHVGDAVPNELKTGEASWDVSDKHRKIAQTRLSMQLVSWMAGDEEVVCDRTQLEMIADEPAMKAKINAAFTEAAKQVGIAEDNKEEMISLIAGLAEEFAYIEALRDQFDHLSVVETRIGQLADLYRHDHGVMETVTQVRKLCDGPMSRFRERFEEIDAQTGEIIAVIKNMASQVKFIRDPRDDLFRRFWAWNEIATKWHDCPARRSRTCEALLAETYRFLAQRFLPQHEWALFTKAQETAKNRASESVWS